MYKIYSRNRINIFKNKKLKRKTNKRLFYFLVIIMTTIITYVFIYKGIEPIFETLCEDKAQEIATIVTNEESTKVMSNYKYNDIFTIEKDEVGNIQMINANIFVINEIVSDIAIYIQKALEKNGNSKVNLSLGSLTGSKILSGVGPNIKIKISSVGNVNTDIKSEFASQGINQTIHRVYLQIYCTVNILTPFEIIEKEISNQVLLVENVVIGQIPSTYYNIQGLEDKQNVLEFIE